MTSSVSQKTIETLLWKVQGMKKFSLLGPDRRRLDAWLVQKVLWDVSYYQPGRRTMKVVVYSLRGVVEMAEKNQCTTLSEKLPDVR